MSAGLHPDAGLVGPHRWRAATSAPARAKLVIYSAMVGPKEALNDPLSLLPADAPTDLELDFVCFTDQRELRSPTWRFVRLPHAHLPPEKLSRRPKALPHLYFPDARYSLYIDNTVAFKRLPQWSDLIASPCAAAGEAGDFVFRAFRHARHTRLEQEAHAIAALGYEDASIICRQLDFYARQLPLSEITPLTTATVLLRQHHHPVVQDFGHVWWENVLAFAKRDQLAFDYALRISGARIDAFEGITRDNPFIQWTGSLSPDRLRASFDERRYAWQHRDDPEALQRPKQHALAHGRGAEPAYQQPLRLLELLCHLQGSSLGQQTSPRRGVADALEAQLAPWRGQATRFVLARTQGLGPQLPQRFEPDEYESAGRAIAAYLGPNAQGTVMDLPLADLAQPEKVYNAAAGDRQHLVVVLGLPGQAMTAALHKLMRLLDPARGCMAMVLCHPASLTQAAEAEKLLADWLGRAPHSALQASRHDGLAGPLANSLCLFSW